jgi:hypothetical protein
MRHTIVTLLVIASAATTTLAVAQDGVGHGPPKASIMLAQPTPAASRVSLSRVFRPTTELVSMTK